MKISLKKVIASTGTAALLAGVVAPGVSAATPVNETSSTEETTVVEENNIEYELTTYGQEPASINAVQPQQVSINNVSVNVVDGGVNLYGENEDGVRQVQQIMQQSNDSVTVFSSLILLPFDVVAGILGGEVIGGVSPFDEGNQIMSDMINSGLTSGGVRITAGGAQPIYSP